MKVWPTPTKNEADRKKTNVFSDCSGSPFVLAGMSHVRVGLPTHSVTQEPPLALLPAYISRMPAREHVPKHVYV